MIDTSIPSRRKIDIEAVKVEQEKWEDWTAYCPVCKRTITGTLQQLKEHKHDGR